MDQRSVGDDLLQGDGFSAQQFGIKAELPVKQALFTVAYTHTTKGTNMQNPWSGYPGYTSVQVEDFNRAGEGAFLLRAGYEFTVHQGTQRLCALASMGTNPRQTRSVRKNEYDVNLAVGAARRRAQGIVASCALCARRQDGGSGTNNLTDFRAICNYSIKF